MVLDGLETSCGRTVYLIKLMEDLLESNTLPTLGYLGVQVFLAHGGFDCDSLTDKASFLNASC